MRRSLLPHFYIEFKFLTLVFFLSQTLKSQHKGRQSISLLLAYQPSNPSDGLRLVKKLPCTRAGIITKDITDNPGNKLMQARLQFWPSTRQKKKKKDQPCIYSDSRVYFQLWQCRFPPFSPFRARMLVLEIIITFNEKLHNVI